MDRKTLLTIVICFGIFSLWQKFYIEPRLPHNNSSTQLVAQQQGGTAAVATQSASSSSIVKPSTSSLIPAESRSIETQTGQAMISNGANFLSSWKLKAYRLGIGANSAEVDFNSVTHQESEVEFALDDPALGYVAQASGHLSEIPGGIAWSYADENLSIKREIRGSQDKPYLDVVITAEFKSKKPQYAFLSLLSAGAPGPDKDPEAQDRALLYYTNQSVERQKVNDSFELKSIVTPVKYIGATNRYFLMALLPEGNAEPKGLLQPTNPKEGRLSLVYPITGNSVTIPFRIFFGPKELGLLRSVEPALDNAVDFGWFTVFAYPLLRILKWLYGFVGNYGVAIILLTLLLKLATYPLTYKSMKSMKGMAKIQPELQKIREKFKDDREAQNKESLAIMRRHGYNPVAGCLPMLIQMPVFFALYRVLYHSIELYHAPFAGWIMDLSSRDPYYVTPVLLSLSMFVQQKVSPQTAADPTQQKMMQFMPLMFGAFMLTLPSGLTLYMLVNALASVLQQFILNKKLDTHAQVLPARA